MNGASERRRLHAIVHGRVQGVGFRATTADEARALALHGWVRNRHDGSVEVVAEGSEASLTRLLDFLRTGPRMANVTQVTVDWSAATGESAPFAVKSTA